MLFITAASVLAALFQVVFAQSSMQINTLTNPTQCEPVQFTWQGGSPPYYLSLVPGGQPNAPAIQQFPIQTGNVFTWIVNLVSGETFTTVLRDSTGVQAFSDVQTVQSGPDNSCLNQSGSMTSTAMTAPASSAMSSAASTNAATTPASSGTSRGTSTTSSMSGSSESAAVTGSGVHAANSATATGSSNAASTPASGGAVGLAGVLGLLGAAFLG